MNYMDIENLEKKIKSMESEVVSLRTEIEGKKAELRKLHDPCPTCGRSDKQTASSTPAVWIYPTVYPVCSNQYYCYACGAWHFNGYYCNKPIPWYVNGTSIVSNQSSNVLCIDSMNYVLD